MPALANVSAAEEPALNPQQRLLTLRFSPTYYTSEYALQCTTGV